MSLPAPHARRVRYAGAGPYPRYDWSGRLSLLTVLLLSVSLSACSDLERAAYRTLAVTKAEYETVQQHVAEAAVHGLITEEQWNRFQVAGHRFIDAHNSAVDAFQMWSRTRSQSDTARLEALLDILPRLLRELNALVAAFEKEDSAVRTQKSEWDDRHPERRDCHPERPALSEVEGSEGSAFLLSSDSCLLSSGGQRRACPEPVGAICFSPVFSLLTSHF